MRRIVAVHTPYTAASCAFVSPPFDFRLVARITATSPAGNGFNLPAKPWGVQGCSSRIFVSWSSASRAASAHASPALRISSFVPDRGIRGQVYDISRSARNVTSRSITCTSGTHSVLLTCCPAQPVESSIRSNSNSPIMYLCVILNYLIPGFA